MGCQCLWLTLLLLLQLSCLPLQVRGKQELGKSSGCSNDMIISHYPMAQRRGGHILLAFNVHTALGTEAAAAGEPLH